MSRSPSVYLPGWDLKEPDTLHAEHEQNFFDFAPTFYSLELFLPLVVVTFHHFAMIVSLGI